MKRIRPLPVNLVLNGIANTADITRGGHKFEVGSPYWHIADHVLNRASSSDKICLYGEKNKTGIMAIGGFVVDSEGRILCDSNIAKDPEYLPEKNLYRLNCVPPKWYQIIRGIDLSDFADKQNLEINFVR